MENNDTTPVTGSTTFSVKSARSVLFDRFPEDLQKLKVYKHFYTEELDGKSGSLSLKFFSLFISYFCSVCRLEARRKQYLSNAKENSGSEFAAAHRMARAVFQRLNATYAEILMTYNCNHFLEFPKKITARMRTELMKGNTYTTGAKPLGPPMHKIRAFSYAADEMRFYEELFGFTIEMLRLAFTDKSLQVPITEEVEKLFRSNAFNFHHARREREVEKETEERNKTDGSPLAQNTHQLADVLVDPAPKVMMKYALKQRSPFIGAQFPGSMASLRFQKMAKSEQLFGKGGLRAIVDARKLRGRGGMDAVSGNQQQSTEESETSTLRDFAGSKIERDFTTETHQPLFNPNHRAMQRVVGDAIDKAQYMSVMRKRFNSPGRPGSVSSPQRPSRSTTSFSPRSQHEPNPTHARQHRQSIVSLAGAGSNAGVPKTPSGPTAAGLADRGSNHTFLPELRDFDLAIEHGEVSGSPGGRDDGLIHLERGRTDQGNDDDQGANMSTSVLPQQDINASPEERALGRWKSASDSVRKFVKITSKLRTTPQKPTKIIRRQSHADSCSPLALRQLASIAPLDENGEEDWSRYDPSPEIDLVYQSLANGVVVTSFGVPLDIMVDYDDAGIMMLARV